MHACIVSPLVHSKCVFKSFRSKIRSQLRMISSLNGEGGGQFSQPIFIPALSQRLSQLSLSSSDKDKNQQLIFHSLFKLSNPPIVCRSKQIVNRFIRANIGTFKHSRFLCMCPGFFWLDCPQSHLNRFSLLFSCLRTG
jgi:hypothetical protein